VAGQIARGGTDVDLRWSPDDVAFREEVRAFIRAHLDEDLIAAGRLMTSVYADHAAAMRWQKILAARGWAAPMWPAQYGGCGWSAVRRYIFAQELYAAGAPPISMGIQMCGPALVAFGTPWQKEFFLPRMLSGEHYWCQGYSEPQAGSDLAALKMKAEPEGDHLVCTGSKIWTTHAHLANWMFCLVRTSAGGKPQQGISFVLIDMATPGIEVRPIISISGEHIQNQVFFDGVRVPLSNVVGSTDQGWAVAKYLLEFERGGVAYSPELHQRLDRIRVLAAQAGLLDDPVFRNKLALARTRISALQMFELRTLSAISSSGSPGEAASIMKIVGTELSQTLTELALEAAGPYGLAYQPVATRPGGEVHLPHARSVPGPEMAAVAPLRYLNDRAGTIYAGSNEIQKNILAKALLAS